MPSFPTNKMTSIPPRGRGRPPKQTAKHVPSNAQPKDAGASASPMPLAATRTLSEPSKQQDDRELRELCLNASQSFLDSLLLSKQVVAK